MRPGDIDLTNPDEFSAGFPHDYFEMLREHEPVSWNEPGAVERGSKIRQGFYNVTRFEDVVHVSRRTDVYSSTLGGAMLADMEESELDLVRTMLITMDPPEHGSCRRFVHRGFTSKRVQLLEPRVREAARAIVDTVARVGKAEFIEEIATPLPLVVICELMGVPAEDRRQVVEWSNLMVGFDDPDFSGDMDSARDVAMQMWTYAQALAETKRRSPDDSLVSLLANVELDGERVSDLELGNFFVLVAAAGSETTRTAAAQGLWTLRNHPDQLDLLRSDLDRHLPGAVEEILRFVSPVMHFRRTVTRDTELAGVKLTRGDKVVLWYPSANRDPRVWKSPDTFDITRRPNPHLAFGIGEHFCLGANLARIELRCLLRELLMRIPDLEIVEPPKRLRSILLQGITEMRVQFTPEAGPVRASAGEHNA